MLGSEIARIWAMADGPSWLVQVKKEQVDGPGEPPYCIVLNTRTHEYEMYVRHQYSDEELRQLGQKYLGGKGITTE